MCCCALANGVFSVDDGILKPTDSTIIGVISMTDTDALGLKHPDPQVPLDSTAPSVDNLRLRYHRISHPIRCASVTRRC